MQSRFTSHNHEQALELHCMDFEKNSEQDGSQASFLAATLPYPFHRKTKNSHTIANIGRYLMWSVQSSMTPTKFRILINQSSNVFRQRYHPHWYESNTSHKLSQHMMSSTDVNQRQSSMRVARPDSLRQL